MPLTQFVCPDGQKINIDACLKSCRMHRRCTSKPILKAIVYGEREWTGVPSVTMLLKGTYETFLELTTDYAIVPDERVYNILGGAIHDRLSEEPNDVYDFSLSEHKLITDDFTGTIDYLITENGKTILYDFKVSGSYKIMKALGIVKIGKGAESKFERDPAKADMFDWVMQLNGYRILLKKVEGIIVNEMYIQAIVRDGGIQAAINRGISEKTLLIEIPFLDDELVNEYFHKKIADLNQALLHDDFFKCTDSETWGGRKCESFCSVRDNCKYNVKR